ncbi:acetylglutamate kinase [Dethiosulfatarculus sandiegensis]|uniref:Acetylglutamate kinase n=2 Tax=Dethiosulfatarculus sandiegensis TaxID=1429043 RepID=A0A0D2HM43_9BACT|nr:acetylglutamate kinase [Dethiosulfatarculus sandiegensis]
MFMENQSDLRARTLMEALPYIRRFAGQTIVVKYGGHAMVDEELKESFALNLILLRTVGIYPVVVHGGGPQIGNLLKRLDIESEFVDGMRVTSPEVMDVVKMVLIGEVNTSIVAMLNQHGGNAVGLSGHSAGLVQAEKLKLTKRVKDGQPPEIVDLGLVGKPMTVNPQVLQTLEHGKFIPVIAPVGQGPDGESLNINADLVASALASGLRAQKLVLLTDTPGVMGDKQNLISEMTKVQARELMDKQTVTGGMIPKLNCCLDALDHGVASAHIIDGRAKNALLLELFTDQGVGTILKG